MMGRLSRQRETKQYRTQTKLSKTHPIEDFFASFSPFVFNPLAPSGNEFQRLRREKGWKRGDAEGGIAWGAFRLALVKEFNAGFGTDASDLLAWQTLCTIIGVEKAYQMTSCEACERVSRQSIPSCILKSPLILLSWPGSKKSAF